MEDRVMKNMCYSLICVKKRKDDPQIVVVFFDQKI